MDSLKNDINVSRLVGYALLAELFLILLQFAYMAIYEASNPGANLSFDTSYMEHVGFFIFQIVGFFVFIIIALYIFRRSRENQYKKVLIFLIAGGIIELAFYLIATKFEPAFLYSILDKVVAIAFAGIMYWASQSKEDFKEGPGVKH